MSRDIDSAVADASAEEVVRPVVLCALGFDSGVVRVTSAPFDIAIDTDGDAAAETYVGVGNLGRVGPVQETTELRATNLELELSGIPPELLSIALAEQYQGRQASLWLVLLDSNHAPVGDACLIFKGRMDTMSIERGPQSRIQVAVESNLADLERARTLRFTDADQQAAYPGDKGFSFVAQAVDKQLIWGKVGAGNANQAG